MRDVTVTGVQACALPISEAGTVPASAAHSLPASTKPAFEYDQSPRHGSGRSSLEFGRRSAVWERNLPTLAPPESDGASRSSRSAASEAVNHFVIDAIRDRVSVSTRPAAASSLRSPTSSPAATAGKPVP